MKMTIRCTTSQCSRTRNVGEIRIRSVRDLVAIGHDRPDCVGLLVDEIRLEGYAPVLIELAKQVDDLALARVLEPLEISGNIPRNAST